LTGDAPRAGEGGVFAVTTRRPIGVAMAFFTLVVFGVVSLDRLPVNLLPDISYPTVTVRAEYPGAAPEDVEERVSKRLHESLSVLPGLESISSISRAGVADVTLQFAWGTELTYAIQDIRERIDRTYLPEEVPTPTILRYDPTLDPMLVIGLTGGRDQIELRRIAEDQLVPALSTLEGAAAVRVRGGLEDEIQVRLDADRIATLGLRPADVVARLAAENVNLASGTLLEGDTEYLVRTLNEYRSPAEIARTILFRSGTSVVRLSDVATVTRTTKERDVITRIDGRESVELQVFKEADANIVELARRVRDRMFGTAEQRAHVRALASGAIEDPERERAALRARLEADPELLAGVMAARSEADGGQDAGGPGGGAPDADGDGAATTPPADAPPITDEHRELAAELAALDEAVREKQAAYDFLAASTLPTDVRVHLLSDQSRFIENALREVRDSAALGGVLAVLVLFLFLGQLGTTLIVAVAIPVSVVVTFTPLHLTGTSLNVMSLGGLALGIGMLVDNAIVSLESIARMRELGMERARAAALGVREIAGAAVASTLTTVAVFAPIVFVEGIAGQIFRDQALTVVASLLVSLVVALFLVPMLASRRGRAGSPAGVRETWAGLWTDPRPARAASPLLAALALPWWLLKLACVVAGRVALALLVLAALVVLGTLHGLGLAFELVMRLPARLFSRAYGAIHRVYPGAVQRLVRSPVASAAVLLVSAALLWWTTATVPRLGAELLPDVPQGEIIGRLVTPLGTPLETTDRIAGLAEDALEDHEDVAWVAVTSGVPRDEISPPDEGEHTARVVVGLDREGDLAGAEARVMARLRERLARVPELREVRFERPSLFSVRAPIVVEVKGEDLDAIADATEAVEASLQTVPGLRDVRSSLQPGNPEVMLSFDRDLLNRHGLDTRTVASAVADMVQGNVATRYSDREHKIDVLVLVDKRELSSLDELLGLPGNPAGDGSEPLSALADVQVREGPREIRRIWGQRAAVVGASLAGFDVGRATEEIETRLAAIELAHPDVLTDIGGQGRETEGALEQMMLALALAVFLVYVVMASLFESTLQPLIILVSVPLATVGAVAALYALDIPLSVVAFIGAIILAGIVVNNAIVLIDAINRRRRLDGLPLEEAVRVACEMRLRPILMTTLTTVLGLLPLTGWLGHGEGVELRAPMAVTVVAGLSASTLLTLFVIPTIYCLVERAVERRGADNAQAA